MHSIFQRENVPHIQSNTVLHVFGNFPMESVLHISFNIQEYITQFFWKYLEESAHNSW
jgi:hypothetical protein